MTETKIVHSSQVLLAAAQPVAWQALRALKNINKVALILATSATLMFAVSRYLHVYIGGKQVAHLNVGASTASITWTCAAGVGLSMVTVFAPGGAVVGWALAGTLSSIGVTLASCAGW